MKSFCIKKKKATKPRKKKETTPSTNLNSKHSTLDPKPKRRLRPGNFVKRFSASAAAKSEITTCALSSLVLWRKWVMGIIIRV